MRLSVRSRTFVVAAMLLGANFAAAPAQAAEDKRACCRIIRIDSEKGIAWLRNPRSALVVAFRLRADERDLFRVGDLFNPETNELDGVKLSHTYAMMLPAIGEPNAHILRVRGHEIAAKMDETGTVYRFHTLKFGNVLSAMKPGGGVVIDIAGDWAFFLYEAYGKVKPSVWAYELE